MDDILKVRALGRLIRGRPSPGDVTGLFIKPKGLQGLEGLSASRREALARAVSHGEHDSPVYLPARVITIDGWAIETSLLELWKLKRRVTGLGATGAKFRFTVDHLGLALTSNVRRILAETDSDWIRAGKYFAAGFQLQVLAADPRQYGTVRTLPKSGLSTSLAVSHKGNFPAHPIFEIPDAPANYSVSSPAGTHTISGATPGGTHRVDLRTGRVTRNGVWMPNVGRGPLWAIPEATEWVHTLSVPGRSLVHDTFI